MTCGMKWKKKNPTTMQGYCSGCICVCSSVEVLWGLMLFCWLQNHSWWQLVMSIVSWRSLPQWGQEYVFWVWEYWALALQLGQLTKRPFLFLQSTFQHTLVCCVCLNTRRWLCEFNLCESWSGKNKINDRGGLRWYLIKWTLTKVCTWLLGPKMWWLGTHN